MNTAASRPFTPTKEGAPGSRLTSVQNLAISLMYEAMGECRGNRTAAEYAAIAARVPPLKQLHFLINEALAAFLASVAAKGEERPEFCRFQARDLRVVYEKYPDQISCETLRKALELHGFWVPQARRKLTH
jgi:hypothetical protein